MKTAYKFLLSILVILSAGTFLSSCLETEDPGPVQKIEKQFSIVDFDRLEMGDAFNITVEQSSFFEINIRGDRRNVDDLSVRKEGSTLVIEFDEDRNRIHDTYITIKMPILYSANFFGASDSKVSGFDDLSTFDLVVSGASVCQLDMNVTNLDAIVSGASYLNMTGTGEQLTAEITGASVVKAFSFPVSRAEISASGASVGQVTVSDVLLANASGASEITYRGDPTVTSQTSGGSNVQKD